MDGSSQHALRVEPGWSLQAGKGRHRAAPSRSDDTALEHQPSTDTRGARDRDSAAGPRGNNIRNGNAPITTNRSTFGARHAHTSTAEPDTHNCRWNDVNRHPAPHRYRDADQHAGRDGHTRATFGDSHASADTCPPPRCATYRCATYPAGTCTPYRCATYPAVPGFRHTSALEHATPHPELRG